MALGGGLGQLPYSPKAGYLSGFTVDPTGIIRSKNGKEDFVLNGVTADLKKLGAAEGTGASIGAMKVDSKGNLLGELSYEVANPNYGKYVRGQNSGFMGGMFGGVDNNKTLSKTEWQQLNGFQLDMNTISKAVDKPLPDQNNIYLRPEGNGFLGEIEAIWEGNTKFTAAYGRNLQNAALQPMGERLTASRGRQGGSTSMLGGAPTSKADGNKAADDINLRNRKGTLLT